MATQLGQMVQVLAVFGDGRKLKPLRFMWGERVCRVKETTYEWSTFRGREKVLHFAVSDGANLYELAYHTDSMRWTLEAVEEL